MRAAFALAVLGMLIALPARASVTYDFIATSDSPATADPAPAPFPTPATIASVTIANSVVESGSMRFTVNCSTSSNCPQPWPDYITGTFGDGGIIPGATADNQPYTIDITFNPDGTLSGSFNVVEVQDELLIGGTGMNWSGILGSDRINNFQVAGYWIDPDPLPVPEPRSIALFGFALAGLVVTRCRGRLPT